MGFFEKLLRGVAGSHGGGHHGRDSSGHHGWGNSYPSNSAPRIVTGKQIGRAHV